MQTIYMYPEMSCNFKIIFWNDVASLFMVMILYRDMVNMIYHTKKHHYIPTEIHILKKNTLTRRVYLLIFFIMIFNCAIYFLSGKKAYFNNHE